MNSRSHFNFICEALFNELHVDETMTLDFRGEVTDYVRWNQSKVRQNTSVLQKEISLVFQKSGRRLAKSFSIQGMPEWDLIEARKLLQEARAEASTLPVDPFIVDFTNNGHSEAHFAGKLLP